MSASGPLIRFEKVTKRFPGVVALSDVSFEIREGACHALCGENGAGKSTLGKILGGIHAIDGGALLLRDKPVRFNGPRAALAAGVGIVHQELAFCENLSVAENLCLGNLPRRGLFVSRAETRRRAEAMLESIEARIDVDRLVGSLTVGQQQMVQIAAAVGSGARVIVFDEPTSSLSQHEAGHLYELIGRLKAQGVTSIYVSHRMPEIFRLCDAVTVMRDGRHVATQPLAGLDEPSLVQMMIGRKIEEYFPSHLATPPKGELLKVEQLSSPGKFEDVSFSLRAGEVLGLAGLVGAGRSELAQALFGMDPAARGGVWMNGVAVELTSPQVAMRHGVGLVPEDRKRQGLVLGMSGRENTTLPTLNKLATAGWVHRRAERALAQEYYARLKVRAPDVEFVTAGMSGGNQQKIVLAKWLAAQCRLLILDEPTRGVDVGAKAEIHALIDELAAQGAAVLLISSELPEVINLSSRILVLRAGKIAGEVPRKGATQDTLMRLMAGVDSASSVAA